MRHAKIVATWGPAVSSYDHTLDLIRAGVNVARLNMSHGTYNVHEGIYRNIRRAETEVGRPIAVLADLQGPKIRLGKFEGGPYELEVGDEFAITTRDIMGDRTICSTTHKGLPGDVNPGDPLLIDDGKVALRAERVTEDTVYTTVEIPGAVSNNKGINLPGVSVNVPALSDKDEQDLRWALQLGVDYIALSFVRDAADITRVHEIMGEEGIRLPVIAKIEKPQAVDHLEEIVDAFDPGARVDDREPAPHPSRGLRLRERDPRRSRRRDAVGRDQRGRIPRAGRRDHGAHHHRHRGPRPRPHRAARHGAPHAGRRPHARSLGCRRLRRRPLHLRVHRVGRHRAAHVAAAPPDPDHRIHPRSRHASAHGAHLGRPQLRGAPRRQHRRDVRAGRRGAARPRPREYR
jgi:hypothetical protein